MSKQIVYRTYIQTTDLTFNGGNGGNFDATFSSLGNGKSGFTILMPEDGNGLTISSLSASGGGTIVGTRAADSISVTALNTASTVTTFDINLRDADGNSDTINFLNGSGGPAMVIIRGFDGSAASTNSTKDTLKIFGTDDGGDDENSMASAGIGEAYVNTLTSTTAAELLSML